MPSIFPYTPTMRYERMFVAAMGALISGGVGLAFLDAALQAASHLSLALWLTHPASWRKAATLGMLAGGCFSLSLSLALSFLIKVHVPDMERYMPAYLALQWLALRLLYVACAFGVGLAVVQGLTAPAT